MTAHTRPAMLNTPNIDSISFSAPTPSTGYIFANVSNRLHLLIVLVLLYLSGNPCVPFGAYEVALVAFAAFLSFIHLLKSGSIPTGEGLFAICLFGCLSLAQGIASEFFPLTTIIGFLIKIYIVYLVTQYIPNFLIVYCRVIEALAILSLVCFIGSVVGFINPQWFIGLDRLADDPIRDRVCGGIHTFFLNEHRYRNSGMLWEPGAFAGYLNLGVLFLGISRQRFISPKTYWRQLVFISVATVTTFSTTGFLAYPLALFVHFSASSIRRYLPVLVLSFPVAMLVSTQLYGTLPFLGEKIETQRRSVEMKRAGWEVTRYGTLLFDLQYIKKRPFIGWGLHSVTRYRHHVEYRNTGRLGFANGMSDFMAKFGLIGFGFWMFRSYIALRKLSGSTLMASVSIMCLLLVLQGEAFLGFPLFFGTMFLSPSTDRM